MQTLYITQNDAKNTKQHTLTQHEDVERSTGKRIRVLYSIYLWRPCKHIHETQITAAAVSKYSTK